MPSRSLRRRDFLRLSLAAGALASTRGFAGGGEVDPALAVAHFLPTVSHDRLLAKASFMAAQPEPPVLRVDRRRVRGVPTDGAGRFFVFDVPDLGPGRPHRLELRVRDTQALEPWELATFPHPDDCPERFRLLIYTCAGGHDIFPWYHPTATRRRLLQRALSFAPDAVVAVGDQVYWDLRSLPNSAITGDSPAGRELAGVFDRGAPVLGHANEQVLQRAVDNQIAGLYGTLLRGTPVFFVRDDHDYFEDDRASAELVTFPADPFMRELARTTQWLYYPEFLPDRRRPPDLTASCPDDRPAGLSEAFGTLRYGELVEALLYDCKGFVSLEGRAGRMVPAEVESWLVARMADPCPRFVVNVPSNPPGWSAGKYGEWYPDVVDDDGRLGTSEPKTGWQAGWLAQHDRLLAAASAMGRLPLFLSGDIHSVAETRILGSGAHDFSPNPAVSVISGTPGTRVGWPSLSRGTLASTPGALTVDEVVPVQEVNGFHLLDFDPEQVTISHFRWDFRTEPESVIDGLQPFHVSRYPRGGIRG